MYRKSRLYMQMWREVTDAEKTATIAKGSPRQRFRSRGLYTNIDQQRYGISTWLFRSFIDRQTWDGFTNSFAMMSMHDKSNRKGHWMVHKLAPVPSNAELEDVESMHGNLGPNESV